MGDAFAFVNHVDDGNPPKGSGVERLAARTRIKGRPVQVNPPAVLCNKNDRSLKLHQLLLIVVEALGHFLLNLLSRHRDQYPIACVVVTYQLQSDIASGGVVPNDDIYLIQS